MMTTKKRTRFRGTRIATIGTAAAAFAVLLAGIATGGETDLQANQPPVSGSLAALQQPISLPSGQQVSVGTAVAPQAPAKSSPPKVTEKRKSRGS